MIEFKSDRKRLGDAELIDAVVGITNTEGGILYLGVEDDGEITGIHAQHADETGVAALIANRTVPAVGVRAELIAEEGKNILKIEIPMSRTIVAASDGKILRRRLKVDGTPENVPMYPYEINTRLSELSLLDFSAQVVSGASAEDFDFNERVRLRNIIKRRNGDKSLIEISDEELDKALRFVKEENGELLPTVTGMLLIGKEERIETLLPTAKCSFQVLEGTKIRMNEQLAKPLLAVFELFENYFKAWNPEREMESGLFRVPIPEFSEAAFREGLVNAFCHRDYSVLQQVRVAIEDEGLTISSPGGFIEGVNLNNLLTVEPHGRNQALADAMKRIGLAEKTGRGIDRIFEGSIIYGRPLPDYAESTKAYVKLFIQRAEADIAFAKMISEEEERLGRSLPINSLLILSALQKQRRMSLSELAAAIHISESRTEANVEKLMESGLLKAVSSGKVRAYTLSIKSSKTQDNTVGYVRQMENDEIIYRRLILALAAKQGGTVTRNDVCRLLSIGKDQAYRLLKKMVLDNELKAEGRTRAVKYSIVT